MPPHFMILPTLSCQAGCTYCFGRRHHPGNSMMPVEVFEAALEWIDTITNQNDSIEITFHGGEPLLAGKAWYRKALSRLRERFGAQLNLGIQSNLWLLDEETCALFREYGVMVGTSLDGPETINDAQRGKGYFNRTMSGIQTARRFGIQPGVICTFTRLSSPRLREVVEFFAGQGLSFNIHTAVCTPGNAQASDLALDPACAGELMVSLLDDSLDHPERVRIPNLEAAARSLAARSSSACVFGACLGKYFAISPGGDIFPCNRFAGPGEWKLGTVLECPSLETLTRSPAWQKLHRREDAVRRVCGGCVHFDTCKGGCPYNAISAGTGPRDPLCPAYQRLFDAITERALEEIFSDENLTAIVEDGLDSRGLMRKGRLIDRIRT